MGWPAQPVPPVSTVEGIIYPLWAFVSQLAPIRHPTLLPVYPSVSQWNLFFSWLPHHTAASVLPLCVPFPCLQKWLLLLQQVFKTKAFDTLGTGSRQKELLKCLYIYIYNIYIWKSTDMHLALHHVDRVEGKNRVIKLHFPSLLVPRMLEMWFTLSNILQRSSNNSWMDKCE